LIATLSVDDCTGLARTCSRARNRRRRPRVDIEDCVGSGCDRPSPASNTMKTSTLQSAADRWPHGMLPIASITRSRIVTALGQPDLAELFPPWRRARRGDLRQPRAVAVCDRRWLVGLARENHGAAGLARRGRLPGDGPMGARSVDFQVPSGRCCRLGRPAHDLAVAAYKAHELGNSAFPAGIVSGLIAGALYNRYK